MSEWYNEALFYHIYPLGLLGAERENHSNEVSHRLVELEKWISHLKELSVSAIYIGPLFESTSHGYDTRDYKLVDKRLGDNEEFKQYVKACHEAGIKVVVDGVFNHTGREFFAFQDLLEKKENSPYQHWYKDVHFGGSTPFQDPFSYAAWRGHYELANLNLYNREVVDYLFDVIRFWIREFDIDGIRLDCADCLTFEFMKEMRQVASQEKEDFWLMGEVIHGDYSRWANPETLHSVTNYELHKGLYSGHNDHNYFEIAHTVRRLFDENGGICRNATLYSFVDNHDVERLASKLKEKSHLEPVYALLYTLPGIPSIYYGSEWGIEGVKEQNSDYSLRPAIAIEKNELANHNPELTEFLRQAGKIRMEHKEIFTGKYKELMLTNRQYAFARFKGESAIITAVNNDDKEVTVNIPMNLPFGVKHGTNLIAKEAVEVQNNQIQVKLKANSATFIQLN